MGKQGPCCHCGVTSTPLWRNGPPEKPVLCNACGSRWRTKGSLVNYTPLHSRAETDDFDDHRVSKFKRVSTKQKEAYYPVKRKYEHSDMADYRVFPPEYGLFKGFDEDNSNRSSSGSAISNSESCAQYGSADASDLTGPSQPTWDRMTSRKRTCVTRPKQSPVEKLTKDLYTIWHEQQSSCMSGYSEENVLLETDKPMVSVEIGHGSMLIRHPSSIAREEESEASSLPVDHKKQVANSGPLMSFSGITEDHGVNSSIRGAGNSNSSIRGTVKINKPPNQGPELERIRREKDQNDKLQILAHHNSPLCDIDMQDILNFEKFASLLANNEQQQLLKFLSSVDTVEAPANLKIMFDSPQFKENLLSFQRLLAEGVFDCSLSGMSLEDSKELKRLIFGNLKKSKWVEQFKTFKDVKSKDKDKINGPEVKVVFNAPATDHSITKERLQDGPHHKLPGAKVRMKSPTRITVKPNYDKKEPIDNDEIYFDAKKVFLSGNDNGSSILMNSSHFTENCEQDLLLNLPTNGLFPQAELLISTSSFASSTSVHPNGVHI